MPDVVMTKEASDFPHRQRPERTTTNHQKDNMTQDRSIASRRIKMVTLHFKEILVEESKSGLISADNPAYPPPTRLTKDEYGTHRRTLNISFKQQQNKLSFTSKT
jgi:hypothetical protein